MPPICCVVCGTERDGPVTKSGRARTPRDWKVLRDQAYCPACKHAAYSLRALILPVSRPVDVSWAELRQHLRKLWSETTRCANWLASELYARDVRRQPADGRLAPMPRIYLYPEARELFPGLPPQSVGALVQEVQRRYRAARYAVLWSRSASLATYRYPVGITIPAQAWSLHEHDGRWIVSVRLSDSRWSLLLRGGPPLRRQAQRLAQVQRGDAPRGSLNIYQALTADGPRVMIKVAAWLPKTAASGHHGTMTVSSDERSLIVAAPQWRIDPAPLRGVLAADARRRQSLLANLHAIRAARGRTDGIERALQDLSRRTQRRLADACRTYAAQLSDYVVSRGALEVHYDDRVRPPLEHFPWAQLRDRIAQKLGDRSIRFVHVGHSIAHGEDGEHAA